MNIGQIIFESLDGDALTSSVDPVTISKGPNSDYRIQMASMTEYDATENGFLPRFIAQAQIDESLMIEFKSLTRTPDKLKFKMPKTMNNGEKGIMIRLSYGDKSAFTLKANGIKVDANEMIEDDDGMLQEEVDKTNDKCGENRYHASEFTFDFFIKPGCEV